MENFTTNIIIRRARKEDENELAALAYRAYYDRFFNPAVTDKNGASLRLYPELVPDEQKDTGQSASTFRDYWAKAMPKLDSDDQTFICYVAEAQTPQGRKIVGFRRNRPRP